MKGIISAESSGAGETAWFTLGILDYIDMFRGTMNAGVKEFVVDTYKAQAEALKGLQGKSGLWHTVLTDAGSYEEVVGQRRHHRGNSQGSPVRNPGRFLSALRLEGSGSHSRHRSNDQQIIFKFSTFNSSN